MILRKPYAFLIRNFRLIHFVMLLFSSFILYKSYAILSFFNEYVATRQFIDSSTLIDDTIPMILLFFSIIMMIFATLIVILFNRKDKPTLFYISNVLYYFSFIILCFISRGVMDTIIFDGLDPRLARVIRDTWLVAFVIQVVFVVFYLVRTSGFDIKKFNFGEDVNELKADDEDSEEFELTTGFDADKVKMKVAMQREELKAFFFENKLIIVVVLFLLIVVIPSAFVAKSVISNKRYVIGEKINLKDFTFEVVDSYITKRNYKGDDLFKGDNSYLIVKFIIENLSSNERGIALDNLRLEVNNAVYMPKKTYYEYFTDIGNGYNNQKISKGKKEYIAVYIVDDKEMVGDIVVRFADKLTVKKSEVTATYYRYIINPQKLDIDHNLVNNSMSEEMKIDTKEVSNAKLNINHYNIKDKFVYEDKGKSKYIINNIGLVLSLNYNFELEEDKVSFADLLSKYGLIRYKYNDLMYYQEIQNITPSGYPSNEVFLSVNEDMKDATEIEIAFKFRNVEYVYKIK